MKNRILIFSGRFFFCLSLSGLVMYAIDGIWGTVAAVALMLFVCIAFQADSKREISEDERVNMPLLLDILMVSVPLGLVAFKSDVLCYQLEIIFVSMILSGVINIVSWFCGKTYSGLNWKQLIQKEIRLDPFIDVIALFVFVVWCIRNHTMPGAIQAIIPVFLLTDLLHQKTGNHSM